METLYGSCSENCAGFCRRHNCNMTVKQIRGRECLKKNCWYLIKNEDHEWWQQRERTKQKRKNRKAEIENMCRMYNVEWRVNIIR